MEYLFVKKEGIIMGFKEFLNENKFSVYRLCKYTNLKQSTVDEYGKSKLIESMKSDMATTIANYFGITTDEFYEQCK